MKIKILCDDVNLMFAREYSIPRKNKVVDFVTFQYTADYDICVIPPDMVDIRGVVDPQNNNCIKDYGFNVEPFERLRNMNVSEYLFLGRCISANYDTEKVHNKKRDRMTPMYK